MTKLWRILKNVGEIAVGIVAIIALWNWLAPNPVRLKVLVKQNEVQIPSLYHEYLKSVDGDRDGLGELHDAATAGAKQEKSAFPSFRVEKELETIRAFTPSVPIFRYSDPSTIAVKIVNNGWKVANNVKVFFPSEGFVEIAKDSKIIGSKTHSGWLDLGALEPSSQFIVTMWTTIPREDIRVVSDAGAANVREWYVSRDENRWVIGFGWPEVLLFGWLGLVVCFMALGLVANAINSKPKRTAGPDEQTKSESSDESTLPR